MGWTGDVLDFWFALGPERWWTADPEFDRQCRRHFLELWREKRELPPEGFLDEPRTALAAVILFDQLPRNMFRGTAEQFATDPMARAVARMAVERGLDQRLTRQQRGFLYMPFQHSEERDDQKRSLLLFTRLGDDEQLRYAHLHHDIIERFGRFPHRNAMLGRAPRPEELAAGEVVPW